MAIDYLTVNNDEPVSDFKVVLPRKMYKLRVVESVSKTSKVKTADDGSTTGGNPMIELKLEVIEPGVIITKELGNDEKVSKNITGLQVMTWLTLTAKAASFLRGSCKKFIPPVDPATLDGETPNFQQFIGREVNAILKTDAKFDVDSDGEFIIIPSTGEKKVVYRHQIEELL